MQAITIAIGKNGVAFFTQQLVAKELIKTLSTMKPPDREIKPPVVYIGKSNASDIDIKLTQGKLVNFVPDFKSVAQQADGVFQIQLVGSSFGAQYNWYEWYMYTECYIDPKIPCRDPEPRSNTFPNYSPNFTNLVVTVPVKFQYNAEKKEWDVVAQAPATQPPGAQPNIPSRSIIEQDWQGGCFDGHVSAATASMVASIDLGTPISELIKNVILSIPGSGDLGNGIKYDFSLGDDGLKFPGNDGIQMGVKGGASYNGKDFTGTPPPKLPIPAPLADSDSHHLNMYVSNYEIDALHWAYYSAGKLNLFLKPQDLPDGSVFNVSKYTTFEPKLVPYAGFVFNAAVTQNAAPVTSFQTAYVFTKAVMDYLESKLPSDVYEKIQGLPSNAFLSKDELDATLTTDTVPTQHFATIENAGKTMAMVLAQDMKFVLTIQNGQPPAQQPHIDFTVTRTDVLTNLGLGVSKNNAQTLQFGFANAANKVHYGGSSIAGFDGKMFEMFTWTLIEANYMQTLEELGKTGAPLPIMNDFKFDFTNAQLSVQQGYVSILANVLYK